MKFMCGKINNIASDMRESEITVCHTIVLNFNKQLSAFCVPKKLSTDKFNSRIEHYLTMNTPRELWLINK